MFHFYLRVLIIQNRYQMQYFQILCLTAYIAQVICVLVPITPRNQRCMMAYTDESLETLKLDITFPRLQNQQESQSYQISITNTETNDVRYDTVFSGNYKKQMNLEQNHVYKICFRIISNRDTGPQMIDYNADVQYHYSSKSITVPDSLLKDEQTKATYTLAERMDSDLQRYKEYKEKRKQNQDEQFLDVMKSNERMVMITYVQLIIIVGVGVYQFFTIRNFLLQKQYL